MVPRPMKPRFVERVPTAVYFKPAGVPLSLLDEVSLGVDELEALRLKDMEGLDQDEAAARMNLSQSTYQRVLTTAREKVTRALVEGRAIRIEGGNYQLIARVYTCTNCGYRWENPDPDAASRPTTCPHCNSEEIIPQWHRGRGRGPVF